MSRPDCAGAILAGGRSERMGGGYKALADLGGGPMIDRVIRRLRGQVSSLLLSVEKSDEAFGGLGLPMVADRVSSHRGPLTGLYSALHHLAQGGVPDWLLLCPCDAPFLPADLADCLLAAAGEASVQVATVRYEDHRQPTFSAWHVETLPEVESAVLERGSGGLMQMLDVLPHAVVDWPVEHIPPFYNVNTLAELQQAAHWLQEQEHGT